MSNNKNRKRRLGQFPSGAKKPTPPAPTNPNPLMQKALGGIASQIKERAAAKQAEQAEQQENEPTGVVVSKPDRQDIETHCIRWTWRGSFFGIIAYYMRELDDSTTPKKKPGDYFVIQDLDEQIDMSAEQAKELGEVLLSAYTWADCWQNYMGEFLMIQKDDILDA